MNSTINIFDNLSKITPQELKARIQAGGNNRALVDYVNFRYVSL